jgi:CheY-like chemotaxis protein
MQPNVIVCDIGLPGMSGYEVARIVRREPWGRSATLIAVTGWGQEDDRRRSSEAGFDHHLVKPVEPDQLVALLAHVRSSEWIPDGSSARSLA